MATAAQHNGSCPGIVIAERSTMSMQLRLATTYVISAEMTPKLVTGLLIINQHFLELQSPPAALRGIALSSSLFPTLASLQGPLGIKMEGSRLHGFRHVISDV